MFRPGNKGQDHTIFRGRRLRSGLGELQSYLLFFNAATGCDTKSTPFKKGKSRSFKKLQDNPELMEKYSVFNKPDATHREIAEARELFLINLYGCVAKSYTSTHGICSSATFLQSFSPGKLKDLEKCFEII